MDIPGEPAASEPAAMADTFQLADMQCTNRVRMLVVDDDEPTCLMVRHALAHPEFDIQSISDPAEAPAAIRSESKFDLVILDYVLPGLSPEHVIELLQQHQPDAALIVITGYPSIEGAVQSLRARAVDYLTKPFQIAQLRQTVVKSLQAKGLLRMTEQALREAIGAAIREKRKSLGMTLSELSRRSGVSLGYLSQIELGKSAASIEMLYRICLGMGIRLAFLFESLQR